MIQTQLIRLQKRSPDYDRPITPSEDRLPIDPTIDVPEGYDESQRDVPGGFTAEKDIMDTWATSSVTPQIVTHWAEPDEASQALFKSTFPMDLRPQGLDQQINREGSVLIIWLVIVRFIKEV